MTICPHCLGECNPLPEGSGYCEKCHGTGWAAPRAPEVALDYAKNYVERAIASYIGDPPGNDFQRGHLAALETVRDEAFPTVAVTRPTQTSEAK